MRDMAFFVIILMVFIIAYGVAAWALLYPNSDLEPILFRNVVRMSYWQMYGELFLEQIEGMLKLYAALQSQNVVATYL